MQQTGRIYWAVQLSVYNNTTDHCVIYWKMIWGVWQVCNQIISTDQTKWVPRLSLDAYLWDLKNRQNSHHLSTLHSVCKINCEASGCLFGNANLEKKFLWNSTLIHGVKFLGRVDKQSKTKVFWFHCLKPVVKMAAVALLLVIHKILNTQWIVYVFWSQSHDAHLCFTKISSDGVFCTISDHSIFLPFLSHISLSIPSPTTASLQSRGSNVDTKELCGE